MFIYLLFYLIIYLFTYLLTYLLTYLFTYLLLREFQRDGETSRKISVTEFLVYVWV